MSKFFRLAALLFASAAMVLTGCQEPEEPTPVDPFENASLTVSLVGADTDAATVSISAEVLKVVSYIVEPTAEKGTYTAEELFENGSLIVLEAEEATKIDLSNLSPATSYTVHVAGRISSSKVWSQVKSLEFETPAEPIIPVLTATLGKVASTTLEINIHTENVARVAHLAVPAAEATSTPSVMKIFAIGTVTNVTNGDSVLEVTTLLPNHEYVIYVAGEVAVVEEFMEDIITINNVKTSDFEQDVRVYDINYRGFKIDVRVDPSVKEQDHAIKWATTSLYTYRANGGGNGIDAKSMNTNDTAWQGINIFQESKTLSIDEAHSYIYKNGEIDDWYFEPPVPGQPQVVMMGEYKFGKHDLGWGMGYYKPMFNENQYYSDSRAGTVQDEAAYWTGFYKNLLVQVQKPEPLSEDLLQVEIETFPDDAKVKVTADESLDRVAIMIMSEYEHDIVASILEPEHMQWYATSLEAMMAGVTMIVDPYNADLGFDGTIQTALTEYFYTVPRDSKFWVDVVGLRGDWDGDGNLDGYEQVYKSFEFYLPEPTKPAPELIVTPLEPTSAFAVGFNVKCPTKDAVKGKYIANYEKEWLMANMSPEVILENYGAELSATNLIAINSDHGLDMIIPSRPNAKSYLAAMIANDEGTTMCSDAIAAWSGAEPEVEKVESDLFETLQGEWTATATVTYSTYNSETEQYEPVTEVNTSKVTIGDVEYPENLTEENYATFQRHGVSRENADLYYGEFKAAAKTFNENNRAQNRILLNGFDFTGGFQPYFEYSDPYSLFVSDTYNGYTSEMPLYDFGPKWYLEVAADGSVGAPFNINYFAPMSSWVAYNNTLYESHFLAYDPNAKQPVGYRSDAEGNIVHGYFPTEVSEDGNTITIKPLVHNEVSYYPNAALYYGSGRYVIGVVVVSDIVLTRNTSAAAPAKVAKKLSGKPVEQSIYSDQKIQTPARPASRSAIGKAVEFKSFNGPKHMTTEQERLNYWREIHRCE